MKTTIERDRVRSFIMNELLDGHIQIGERLSLPYFSDKLKCSVTPIREALTQLAYVKVIEAVPNRGFIIPALNAKEAKNIYKLIAALEVLALENSSFSARDVQTLKRLADIFDKTEDPLGRIKADFQLHDQITRNCDNPLLQQSIMDVKLRVFAYEKQFMDRSNLATRSSKQHQKIIDAIEHHHLSKAAQWLRQNWHIMLEFIQDEIK